jgi:hypothetical protein
MKQLNALLVSLIKASEQMKKEKFSIVSLANWCDKAKEFDTLSKAVSKATKVARKDESVALKNRMGLGILTVTVPKVKARVMFKAVRLIATEQAKRVKTIHKNWKHISKHLSK